MNTTHFFTLCLVLFAVLFSPAFAEAQEEEFTCPDYVNLIERYRGGSYIGATRALMQTPRKDLEAAQTTCQWELWPGSRLKTAALIHADVVLLSHDDDSYHLRMGRASLQQINDPEDRKAFERQWLLALGYHFYDTHKYDKALRYLNMALRIFPDDLEIRMLMGRASEWWGIAAKVDLKRAENIYRGILEFDQDYPEAHLRLGRVLHQGVCSIVSRAFHNDSDRLSMHS